MIMTRDLGLIHGEFHLATPRCCFQEKVCQAQPAEFLHLSLLDDSGFDACILAFLRIHTVQKEDRTEAKLKEEWNIVSMAMQKKEY